MSRTLIRITFMLSALMILLAIATLKRVDRMPYASSGYYHKTMTALDSLNTASRWLGNEGALQVGWGTVNITPEETTTMAGYGAREPMEHESIKDSVYIKTIILKQGDIKAAIVTADLLLIHPAVDEYVSNHLPPSWSRDELYFTASHTHSSIGGWAPGLVGELFAGSFDQEQVAHIGNSIVESLYLADSNLGTGSISFGEIMMSDLVRNRLVKQRGIVDPWFKVLSITKDSLQGFLNFYSAHATTLDHKNRAISGDYPALLNAKLQSDPSISFAAFAASAVGSMAPIKTNTNTPETNQTNISSGLFDQHLLFRMLGGAQNPMEVSLTTFRLPLALPEPSFKVSKNLMLRPYLFHHGFGNYSSEISVLILGKIIMIGLPVEFSGELAVPLYEYARSLGLDLIITSFNGDYGGYVVKDEWYDLNKYEARTMSWQGPYAGSYISEVVRQILTIIYEHQ